MSTGNDDQDRMMQNTQRLDDATLDLEESNAILEDTIGVEMDSLQELRRQREVIEKSNDRLTNIDGNVQKADKTLSGMLRRAITNKIFLCIIVLIFIVIIGVVIYLGFFVF